MGARLLTAAMAAVLCLLFANNYPLGVGARNIFPFTCEVCLDGKEDYIAWNRMAFQDDKACITNSFRRRQKSALTCNSTEIEEYHDIPVCEICRVNNGSTVATDHKVRHLANGTRCSRVFFKIRDQVTSLSWGSYPS